MADTKSDGEDTFVVLRALRASELGWFASVRKQGREQARQRGLNFNSDVMDKIFSEKDLAQDGISVFARHFPDGKFEERPIRRQQKNWRLVGDCVDGPGLENVAEGDFFWARFSHGADGVPHMIWGVVTKSAASSVHKLIRKEMEAELADGMVAWEGDSPFAKRVSELVGIADARSGSQAFRPRARIIRTLGRELIANEVVALQELIKNAYDADARSVKITFVAPLTPGVGEIIVEDDGNGMTLDTLQNSWMEPATTYKVVNQKSRLNRRVTGEKGIGRFASARIGRKLELTSVSRESGRMVEANFNWGAFDNDDRFLDEIRCDWEERSAPANSKSGTRLLLRELNDDWEKDEGAAFVRLNAALARLVSPLSQPDDFRIEIITPPDLSQHQGEVRPPAILGRPHYWLTGDVGRDGTIDALYYGPDEDLRQILEGDKRPVIRLDGNAPRCGPFSFEFRVWDRGKEDLDEDAEALGASIRDIRRDLDAASGISIYRDRFRILLPDTDWLGLDLRRVNNPTLRVSNNQVVGVVSISRDGNPSLLDQSSRQGIIDTPEFGDFQLAVREVISKLETQRAIARQPAPRSAERDSKGIFGKLEIVPLRDYIKARYPKDAELLKTLEETTRQFTEGVTEVKRVVARYQRLATLGRLVDGVLHDGRTPLSAIANAARFGRRDISKASGDELRGLVERRFSVIEEQSQRLFDLFRRIEPFSGRKRGRPRETTMEEIISKTVGLASEKIEALGVLVTLPKGETKVTVDESEMQMLFFNLLDNALYWLGKVPEGKRQLQVDVERTARGLNVIVADSGPGVPQDIRDHIFGPYFSARPEGIGLGLTLAGELAAEYDGELVLLENGPLDGAAFQVSINRRVGEN
ncbi:sensor histidine kinase [Pyxidicoccus trucidator]|uniref:sensor histidine kinase n=1 Tax=Pyxidicoccus trucidator TaxID=2709662 RepID=UPI0013D9EC9B|nr:sensor histidine kinase [Pyxidicoccus trucidator]